MLKLRPYQAGAVAAVLAKLNEQPAAIAVAPTGAGKTEMIAGVIRVLPAGARVLVVQHLLDLVAQNAKRIAKYLDGRTVVTLAGSLPAKFSFKGDATKADTVIGTVQTVGDMLQYLGRFDLLVIDEAHHSEAASYRRIVETLRARNPNLRIFGTTATPERADRVGLDWLFGEEPAAVIPLVQLIGEGWLTPPRVLAVPLECLERLNEKQLGGAKTYSVDVMHREVIRTWREHAAGRQTVFFCANVEAAEGLAAAFSADGVDAACVSYETPVSKRTQMLRDFADSKGPQVLTNALLLTEGFDARNVSCVGLLRKFATKSLLVQAVGRGLRLAKGKSDCVVLDYVAAVERHKTLFAGTSLKGRQRKQGEERGPQDGRAAGSAVVLGEGDAELQDYDAIGVKVSFVANEVETHAEPEKDSWIIGRAEAKARGLKTYFTGEPCANGHVSERRADSGNCCDCASVRARERYRDPNCAEQLKEKYRKRYQNPEYRARSLERNRKRQQDPEVRARHNEKRREQRQTPAYRARHNEQRGKQMQNPDFRERIRDKNRKQYLKRKRHALLKAAEHSPVEAV